MSREAFRETTEKQFYFFDGLAADGVFDDGSDLATRFERSRRARLQLNGAGGEIYREIWNVGDTDMPIAKFLQLRYDFGDYGFCRGGFDKAAYFDRFSEKVREILGIRRDRLTRTEMEMLFPFLRNIYGAGNNVANNQISPALLPFVEPRFIYPSFEIPIRWKLFGRFNEALLRAADPLLARHDSAYGHDFSHPPTLARKVKRLAEMKLPVSLRLAKRGWASKVARPLPYYLEDDYLREVLGAGPKAIDELVDTGRIGDPIRLSRALSAELVLTDRL
jgi:hypothetical protein